MAFVCGGGDVGYEEEGILPCRGFWRQTGCHPKEKGCMGYKNHLAVTAK